MSEYWKSTPKYWCKHCKVFVRDTKLERQNHDATPRHQGNIKRFLRDLHRGHEKEERDKDRAKSEVARLNGIVSGQSEGSSSSGFGRGPTPSRPRPEAATASQRKQQLAQLAEMGVAIPDDFRGEMAMAGEWQVTSERIIDPTEGSSEKKPDAIGFGVRKRPITGEEEEEEETIEEAEPVKRKRWGSTYRSHPTIADDDDADLDALLQKPIITKADPSIAKKEGVQDEVKEEPSFTSKLADVPDVSIKSEPDPVAAAGTVFFKKRKSAKTNSNSSAMK